MTTQFARSLTRLGFAAALLAGSATASMAQTPATPAAKTEAATAAAPAGDQGLKSRIESLEEQLVDMQVVVGTLESLSKNGGNASAPAFSSGGSGADTSRIDGLETQIRALTAQVQQLSDQIRSMGGTPRRADASEPDTYAEATPAPPIPPADSFGSTTVTPSTAPREGDPIGGLIDRAPSAATAAPPPAAVPPRGDTFGGAPPPVSTAALPPAGDGTDPKQLYETAYGYLLQRDYPAAETAFTDFLGRFPSDSLAGNAQYWLGESFFVRGQYKAAAGAFLKGYQSYAQSAKAPDSLLKLAMSLDRLGQKDAACSSYSELSSKFPNAPQSVAARAKSERARVGCP